MRSLIAAALAGILVVTPGAAFAQSAPPAQSAACQPQQHQAPSSAPPPASDPLPAPADLGLSLNRIRRELRESPPTKSTLLRYDFHVDVFGQNPKVDFFKDFDLSPNGPVRYGGMTHSEFLNVVTPQAFRAPSGDLLSLAVLAFQQLSQKRAGSDKK